MAAGFFRWMSPAFHHVLWGVRTQGGWNQGRGFPGNLQYALGAAPVCPSKAAEGCRRWHLVVDTGRKELENFQETGNEPMLEEQMTYEAETAFHRSSYGENAPGAGRRVKR